MTKIQLAKPDYDTWAKHGTWHLNAAAFLLNGIDPNTYKSVRLAHGNVPPEFEQAKQTLSLLQSIPWKDQYKDYYVKNYGVAPAAMVAVLANKGIEMPAELRQIVEEHYQHEIVQIRKLIEKSPINSPNMTQDQNSEMGNRERRSWQSGFAIMTRLLAKKIGKINSDDEVTMSSSQILQMMLDEAERIGFPLDGIKSFDRKITSALQLLEDEKSN